MDDIKTQGECKHTHKAYICFIQFYRPDSGPVRIVARDEEHAKELLIAMLPNMKDVKILEIVEESKIQQTAEQGPVEDLPDEEEEPKKESIH